MSKPVIVCFVCCCMKRRFIRCERDHHSNCDDCIVESFSMSLLISFPLIATAQKQKLERRRQACICWGSCKFRNNYNNGRENNKYVFVRILQVKRNPQISPDYLPLLCIELCKALEENGTSRAKGTHSLIGNGVLTHIHNKTSKRKRNNEALQIISANIIISDALIRDLTNILRKCDKYVPILIYCYIYLLASDSFSENELLNIYEYL